MKQNKRDKAFGRWKPIAAAPFQWHSEEDDGSVEWGRITGRDSVAPMSGWDFYYGDPTHWRPRDPPLAIRA